ncbi:MAG TPA: ABC transporter permease [Mycobacteriales bacterium]|nr:ABC transporter permease [Mycobacteriales bacterium]
MSTVALDLSPAPGRASYARMLARQTWTETLLTLRRGESLLLTLVIPLGLLGFFCAVDVLPTEGARRVDFLTPGILALAITSTGFTGLAIATGFERSYGVLRRLGATPLPRGVLLAGKTLAVVAVELVQLALIALLAAALGWHAHGSPAAVVLLVVVGTVTFCGLGLLMAGTLPALVTLAAANGIYLVLLLLGAVVIPASKLGALEGLSRALPTGALAHALRRVLLDGASLPGADLGILLGWAVAALTAAALTFRWE